MRSYKKMNRAERAVAIAKDVLKHLDLIQVTHGRYLMTPAKKWPTTGQVQPKIDKVSKDCKVCAKGALFLSKIRLADNFTFDKLIAVSPFGYTVDSYDNPYHLQVSEDVICKNLNDAFDKRTLDRIERFFENYIDPYDARDRADPAGMRAERLRYILKYIIENKGQFRSKQLLKQLRDKQRKAQRKAMALISSI